MEARYSTTSSKRLFQKVMNEKKLKSAAAEELKAELEEETMED